MCGSALDNYLTTSRRELRASHVVVRAVWLLYQRTIRGTMGCHAVYLGACMLVRELSSMIGKRYLGSLLETENGDRGRGVLRVWW